MQPIQLCMAETPTTTGAGKIVLQEPLTNVNFDAFDFVHIAKPQTFVLKL